MKSKINKSVFFILLVFSLPLSKGWGWVANAQTYVTIPDSVFAHWLIQNFPIAMSGNQMDITSSAITTYTDEMGMNGIMIKNLSGIEHFTAVTDFECTNGLPVLNALPALPPHLKILRLMQCPHLKSLPALPNTLQILSCHGDSLTNLPTLPNSITNIDCSSNFLTNLPALPNNLTSLNCTANLLTSLPDLPNALQNLTCDGNLLTNLPALPNSLTQLLCRDNQLTSLPALPDSLLYFYCNYNKISCFPPFPNSIRPYFFGISNNSFTCLPNYIKAMDSTTLAYPLCEIGNPNGCPAIPTNVIIPNIFTPNGDNINDEFFINATDIVNFSCKIYDRWGTLVFQFTDVSKGWNGKEKNGTACYDGVYYYLISYTDNKGKVNTKNGFFQLLL